MKRTSHGMILAEDGRKMSKSFGNVINPDDLVREYGADTVRAYEMFIGAFEQTIPWSTTGVMGCRRFLDRVWRMLDMVKGEGERPEMRCALHTCIKKVTEDTERMKFNTAIAAMMSLVNDFYQKGDVTRDELHTLLVLMNPVCPHITEEMNELIGFTAPIYEGEWPKHDEAALVKDEMEIAVQVNGKIRARMNVPVGMEEAALRELVLSNDEVKPHVEGKNIVKFIAIRNIVNIVVK